VSYQNSSNKYRIPILVFVTIGIIFLLFVLVPGPGGLFDISSIGIIILLVTFPIIITLLIVHQIHHQKAIIKSIKINDMISLMEIGSFDSLDPRCICVLCRSSLSCDEHVVVCPNCNCYFHSNHLIPLLQNKYECPICSLDYNLILED
jgi:hypothetical protein